MGELVKYYWFFKMGLFIMMIVLSYLGSWVGSDFGLLIPWGTGIYTSRAYGRTYVFRVN